MLLGDRFAKLFLSTQIRHPGAKGVQSTTCFRVHRAAAPDGALRTHPCSIVQWNTTTAEVAEKWTLKQVQGDVEEEAKRAFEDCPQRSYPRTLCQGPLIASVMVGA